MHVPFVDLRAQAKALRAEYTTVFHSVIDRAAYTLGPELERFEADFAALCGCREGVGVSSGTDALKLALLAGGVGPGDEVILPVNTFIASAEAVSQIGARPVFVDVDAESALLDVLLLEGARSERTRAIVPVHLFGQPCDMDEIVEFARRHRLAVVEDACQAHGATYKGRPAGSFGVAAAFSFYPGKNLGALGDGGAVTTSDPAVAERLRLLRNHGQSDKFTHAVIGYCDRMHNLQAAFLNVKLPRLGAWTAARRRAAARYDELLAEVRGVAPIATRPAREPVHHLYVVRVEDRDAVRERLAQARVETGIHYPVPLHLQPAYAHLGYRPGDFPVAERLAGCILSVPMFPELTTDQQDHVVASLAEAVTAGEGR